MSFLAGIQWDLVTDQGTSWLECAHPVASQCLSLVYIVWFSYPFEWFSLLGIVCTGMKFGRVRCTSVMVPCLWASSQQCAYSAWRLPPRSPQTVLCWEGYMFLSYSESSLPSTLPSIMLIMSTVFSFHRSFSNSKFVCIYYLQCALKYVYFVNAIYM